MRLAWSIGARDRSATSRCAARAAAWRYRSTLARTIPTQTARVLAILSLSPLKGWPVAL